MHGAEVQSLFPKVRGLGNLPLAFFLFVNFIYLLFQGPGNTSTWLKNQKVQKETVQVYLTLPQPLATCLHCREATEVSQFLVCFFKEVLCKYMHIQYIYICSFSSVVGIDSRALHTYILFKMAIFLNPQVVDTP